MKLSYHSEMFIVSEYHTWGGRACWRNMELLLLGKKRGRQRKQAPESPLPRATPDTWLDLEPISPEYHMTPLTPRIFRGRAAGSWPHWRGHGYWKGGRASSPLSWLAETVSDKGCPVPAEQSEERRRWILMSGWMECPQDLLRNC